MTTVTALDDAPKRSRDLAIGMFDGVHIGHREVIDGADTVLTFEPHPMTVIQPQAAPKLLMPFELKRAAIQSLGVAELVVIPFDEQFAARSAEDFIDSVLVDRLGAKRVSVGENFRFGAKARGDTEMLRNAPQFETRVAPIVEVDGESVSSSRIRALVAAGDVETASRYLGAPFTYIGEVVPGDRRGRTLGFPTANVLPDDRLAVPGHGVYAAVANGHPAAVSVGVRPTFDTGRSVLIEAYLMDFDGDLYGEELRIEFLQRLRGEHSFEDEQALVEQMRRDAEDARRVCASLQRR